jgi:hypothetical protein
MFPVLAWQVGKHLTKVLFRARVVVVPGRVPGNEENPTIVWTLRKACPNVILLACSGTLPDGLSIAHSATLRQTNLPAAANGIMHRSWAKVQDQAMASGKRR